MPIVHKIIEHGLKIMLDHFMDTRHYRGKGSGSYQLF